MKELRRHQSGWVITLLTAVRNDWQSKLVLPRGGRGNAGGREGSRESRRREWCTPAILLPRHFLVNRFPSRPFVAILFPLPLTFPRHFSSPADSISFVHLREGRVEGAPFVSFFSRYAARRAENRASPAAILRREVGSSCRTCGTRDYGTCNRNHRSSLARAAAVNTRV